ncbi:hypothetical protein PybrP1_006329 [[Pythium] brassicae (nom. inval.)]|nr:hypothetical protein PybrP1_006329 [[Pythium] brassicae (nom. inval.)]
MRAAAFPSASTQSAALPGLRAHFQTLPFRLPSFPSASPSNVSAPQDLRHPSPPPPQQPSSSSPREAVGETHSVTAGMNEPEPELEPSQTSTQANTAGAIEPLRTVAMQQEAGELTVERDLTTLDSDAMKGKKAPVKRVRPVKNANRSTKSKARPGLRKGKWTDEESRYATQLTYYFKEGLLPIDRGTMLRLYLSQKLNCEPMRITKKFTGVECIGKQVFRPCHATPESRVRMMQAQLELVALEAAFVKKLKENREEVPGAADDNDCSSAAESGPAARPARGSSSDEDDGFTSDSSSSSSPAFARVGSLLKKPSALAGAATPDEDADSANAVGLLLDFFHKANRNETKRADASSVANSPTKRIRALSISNYVPDESLTKRSRVDAAPAVFAK